MAHPDSNNTKNEQKTENEETDTNTLIHSPTHSPTHSLTHSLTTSLAHCTNNNNNNNQQTITSGERLAQAAWLLKDHGAKRIFAFATHGLFLVRAASGSDGAKKWASRTAPPHRRTATATTTPRNEFRTFRCCWWERRKPENQT